MQTHNVYNYPRINHTILDHKNIHFLVIWFSYSRGIKCKILRWCGVGGGWGIGMHNIYPCHLDEVCVRCNVHNIFNLLMLLR